MFLEIKIREKERLNMKNKLLEELSEPIRQEILEVEKMEAEIIRDTKTPKEFKIYNLNKLEQISYIKEHTNFLNDIS